MYEMKSAAQTMEELGSSPAGLSAQEAAARLARDGENALKEKDPPTRLQMFLAQLRDPMIYVLIAAAVISVALREFSDAVIILCVVLLNAIVGMVQEGKAQRALDALKKMSSPTATVRRDGVVQELPAAQLVKGDIVLLDAGRVVPADLRLVSCASLKADESALTGESVPSEKDAAFIADGEIPLGDRHNMVYSSTNITYGRGEGIVVATAADTEIGKIAAMLQDKDELTPLQKSLAVLGKLLGIIAVLLCAALFGIALLQGRDVVEMLLTAISLAVAAVPEGLPAVVTIVLAMGVQRMVRVNSIVRRLPAVETLGAVSVVCSDKTGTLTQNKMTVTQVYLDGEEKTPDQLRSDTNQLFLDGFILCNDASIQGENRIGDPTELALLDMGAPLGLTREGLESAAPRINEQAFDSGRKMMTTVHRNPDGKVVAYTKGAVDQLLRRCIGIAEKGTVRPITEEDKERILAAASGMSRQALRVLAMAVKYDDDTATEEDLNFVGLVGMIDPARPEAKAAVESFREAGITTIMITGDHRDTALAIAKELGIAESEDQCITGEELDAMSEEELAKRITELRVFARVSPENKVGIVKALKANGKIVSMTGDGVNDAPSLKAADIGVAMGITGTDVAKGAADMVLTDDNFATIEKAIEEGRGIYNNIKKTVIFLLGSNLGEVISMFTAIVAGLASPLKAVHILWVNLITDTLPALALGADDKPIGIMKRKPRDPKDSLFAGGGLFLTLFYGVLIAMMMLAAFLYLPITQLLAAGSPINVGTIDELLTGDLLVRAQTFAFTVLAVSQLWHSLGMRDVDTSIFITIRHENKLTLLSFFGGLALQICATEIPLFAGVFGTATLAFGEWLGLIVFSMLPLLFHEIFVPIRRALHIGERG